MIEIKESFLYPMKQGVTMRTGFITGIAWLLVASTSWTQGPASSVYSIDAAQSHIELTVYRGGILKMFGHDHAIAAKGFSGEVRFNPGNIGDSSVQLAIDAASLVVLNDPKVSEDDRKTIQADMEGAKVLNIREFPKITFRSTKVERASSPENLSLRGKLGLHGMEKEIAFPIRILSEMNRLRVTGTAVIVQTDFGIKPIRIAAGGLRVKDQVTVKFDILAQKAN